MDRKKIILAIIVAVILVGTGGYFYWAKKSGDKLNPLKKAGEAADIIKDSATKGVLPSLQTNPLENKPEINPVDKTNPYKNIKTNPFE